jgi:predicted nucleic acid-binding protein
VLIDSSVIVRFFSKEPGWERLDAYVGENLTLGLAISELGSALSKKVNENEVSKDLAVMLLKEYSEKAVLLDEKEYINLAFEYSITKKIRIYDGLFVAAAFTEGLTLVSCDNKQCNFAENIGVEVIRC